MTTAQQATETHDFRDLPADQWWDAAAAFIAERYPAAKHVGVGFWRIPRVATIHYFCGAITIKPL